MIKLIALRFFNIKNLVIPKICITFANEIQKDNELEIDECKFFQDVL